MIRLPTLLILPLAALTGCGEVVVFGHVVREDPSKTEAAAPQPAAEAVAPKPAAEAAASGPATEAATSKPASEEAAAPKPATATDSAQATRETSAPAAAALPATHALHAVNVTLSPASQAGDTSVDATALLDAIRTELKSRNLLDEINPSANGTAEVLIESATTRSTVNAVIFGQRPMAGTLTGELHVSSSSGTELQTSRIVAESRLTIADDGQDKNALGPLYRRFAELTADELTSTSPKPNGGKQRQKP